MVLCSNTCKIYHIITANTKNIASVVSSPLPNAIEIDAQTPVKAGLETSTSDENSISKSRVVARRSMENKKNCTKDAHTVKLNQEDKEMEAQAATKIQAGFRGYQVRKQLKMKVSFCFIVTFFEVSFS